MNGHNRDCKRTGFGPLDFVQLESLLQKLSEIVEKYILCIDKFFIQVFDFYIMINLRF